MLIIHYVHIYIYIYIYMNVHITRCHRSATISHGQLSRGNMATRRAFAANRAHVRTTHGNT